MTAGSTRPRASKTRRAIFCCLIALGLVLLSEVSSLIGLFCIERDFSFKKLHRQQDQVAERRPDRAIGDEVLHPYLGWVLNHDNSPNVEVVGEAYAVNEYGFLDRGKVFHRRAGDKCIVAIVGGSVAWYLSIHGTDALIRELKKSPRFADKDIEIVALALSSYKQPQQLFALSYLLALGAEFDVVVNVDGFNEVALHTAENATKDVFYAYPRNWYARVREIPHADIAFKVFRLQSTRRTRREWAEKFSTMSFRYSPTINLIWQSRDRNLQRTITADRIAIQLHLVSGKRSYLQTGPPQPYTTDKEMFAQLAQLWRRCSLQLHRLCEVNGIQYFHVLQPNQYVAGSKPMSDAERKLAVNPEQKYREGVIKAYPILVRAGAELVQENVRFFDMTQLFADTPAPIYIDDCCHYNQQGNEMLATAIAQRIAQAQSHDDK